MIIMVYFIALNIAKITHAFYYFLNIASVCTGTKINK